ncbi:hypothetical protein Btru_071081 [Bulinus truncatus]|nr:hypothetical protein Btru_071081 [Bulinus truncatus]
MEEGTKNMNIVAWMELVLFSREFINGAVVFILALLLLKLAQPFLCLPRGRSQWFSRGTCRAGEKKTGDGDSARIPESPIRRVAGCRRSKFSACSGLGDSKTQWNLISDETNRDGPHPENVVPGRQNGSRDTLAPLRLGLGRLFPSLSMLADDEVISLVDICGRLKDKPLNSDRSGATFEGEDEEKSSLEEFQGKGPSGVGLFKPRGTAFDLVLISDAVTFLLKFLHSKGSCHVKDGIKLGSFAFNSVILFSERKQKYRMSLSYTRTLRGTSDRFTSSSANSIGSGRLSAGSSSASGIGGSRLSAGSSRVSTEGSTLGGSSSLGSRFSSVSSAGSRFSTGIAQLDRAGGYTTARATDVTSTTRTGLFLTSSASSLKSYAKPSTETVPRRPSYTGNSYRAFEPSKREVRSPAAPDRASCRSTEQCSTSKSAREAEPQNNQRRQSDRSEEDDHQKIAVEDAGQKVSFRRRARDEATSNHSEANERVRYGAATLGNTRHSNAEVSVASSDARNVCARQSGAEKSNSSYRDQNCEEKVSPTPRDSFPEVNADVCSHPADEDQGKKNKVNGATRTSVSNAAVSTSAANKSQKEIIRLESLCESRTKDLIQTKMQLKAAANGFDAMAIVVNYCCNELNAFDCPFLMQRLEKLKAKLAEHLCEINELNNERDRLNQSLAQAIQEKEEASKQIQEALTQVNAEREEHVRITHEMDDTHNASLTAQRDELTKKHDESLQKYVQYYDKQLDLMKHAHERQLSEMKNENKLEMNGLKIAHLEEIQVLRNKHDSQMEDLHQQHRNKLEDITLRFESIKLTLSDKVESLRGECEELRHRARNSEEALQRDADVKVQIALAPYMSLPKEIESLKTVLEMRNEEIQKLRNKNTDQEKQLEELPIAKEKIISLQQKVENLQAIINIKSDHEKQLHEHCQILMRKYDRASRANKRLSMDYEQVMWRMSQSSEFGSSESLTQRQLSKSPPPRSDHGSPEGRHCNVSPNISGEVVMRKKRNSHSVGDGDRKLRSRSATFVVEKTEEGGVPSPSSSPQPKLKRWRKKPDTDESRLLKVDRRFERMCRSAGSEILIDSSHQESQSELGENVLLSDATDSMTSSVEMGESYSYSISGVSDSGVYDSMTRSDMLNSSVISSDLEWVNSGNNSFILDNSADEFSLQSGDFGSLNDSLLRHSATGKSFMKASNTVVFCPTTKDASGDDVLESVGVEDVFDDVMSMDSSICSIDNVDVTICDKQNS